MFIKSSQKLYIILVTLFLLSCSDEGVNPVYGCLDPESPYYCEECNIDDGSCNYNEDLLGECDGNVTDKGVWVKGFLGIILNMDCIRCLNKLDICIDINIDEEYRYDDFMDKEFDDNFIIDDSNHLSLRECLREYIFVTSPRKPVCKKICKL